MKTDEILNLDYREEENQEIIQQVLRKIKPLSKYSDEYIPLDAIEKLIKVLSIKYAIRIQYINVEFSSAKDSYYIVSFRNDDDYGWLGNCYGITMYELLSKAAIKMFSDVKTHNIPLREESDERKKR